MVYLLSALQFTQGLFSLIFVSVAIIVAIFITKRYFQYSSKEHLFVGLAWIGLAGPWFSDAIVFLSILFGNLVGLPYGIIEYTNITIFVSILFTYYAPIALMLWLTAFTKLLNLKTRTSWLLITGFINMIFEIMFIIGTLSFFSLMGTYSGPFSYQWGILTTIFYIFTIIVALYTGILFGYRALKTDNKEGKLRGKLLILSFILFSIGSLIPYVWFDIISLIITRLILVLCVITFYFGLNMPDFVKKILL